MRRPTRPFTVEPESRRKGDRASASDEGRLIDEPAPEDVPSRDVHEDVSASGGINTPPTTVSLGDSSSAFAPRRAEPSEPSPAAPDKPPQSERIPSSPVPASVSGDTRPENRDDPQSEPGPKRRRTPARKPARAERAPDRDEQAAESARPAMMPDEQESVAEPSAPTQEGYAVPDAPKLTWRRTEPRVPAGEGWKRRRLPKVCW
jgi:hypothetical protein